MSTTDRIPSLDEIAEARRQLGQRVRRTPVWRWRGRHLDEAIASSTEVHLKLELFQYSGTFKPRGALLNMLALSPAQLAKGVTAVSAGNHAMAVSFACRAPCFKSWREDHTVRKERWRHWSLHCNGSGFTAEPQWWRSRWLPKTIQTE